ncbi:MAG: hypothetical protein WCJ35_19730 [Planctomycetota bacterium]
MAKKADYGGLRAFFDAMRPDGLPWPVARVEPGEILDIMRCGTDLSWAKGQKLEPLIDALLKALDSGDTNGAIICAYAVGVVAEKQSFAVVNGLNAWGSFKNTLKIKTRKLAAVAGGQAKTTKADLQKEAIRCKYAERLRVFPHCSDKAQINATAREFKVSAKTVERAMKQN